MSTTIATDLARLDRLPRWPWTNGLLANLGGSFFFAFFDIVVIGAALPVIITDFDVSASAAAWAVTVSLIGLVVGEFLGATLATRKGRVFTLRTALWVFSIGMILSACAPGLGWLIVARFIAGIGTGADIAVAITYISEICPARMRGKITGFTTVCGYVGIAIVPFLAAILLPQFTWGWRVLFAFGALGAVVLVLTRRHMPPSPRFLAEHGEEQELSALVDQAEARVRTMVGELPPLAESLSVDQPDSASTGKRRWALLAVLAIAWIFYYFGNYGWLVAAPTILTQNGFGLASSLAFIAVANLGLIVGAISAFVISDRFERKRILLLALLVWALSLSAIGIIGTQASIAVFGFVAAFTIGLVVPTFYTYTAENFSNRMRPVSMAFTDGIGHLGAAAAPIILIGMTLQNAFLAMAGSGLVTAALLLRSRRTKGRTLEELA